MQRWQTCVRLTAVVISASVLSACSDTPDDEDTPLAPAPIVLAPPEVDSEETEPVPAPQLLPGYNYDERRGSTYYYIAALSDEDEKRGRAAGSVSSFQYLGINSDGEHVLASLYPTGEVSYRAKCSATCKIIDTDYGERIAYSPRSIIGAAFQDAFRGKLRIADWARSNGETNANAHPRRSEAISEPPPTEGGDSLTAPSAITTTVVDVSQSNPVAEPGSITD